MLDAIARRERRANWRFFTLAATVANFAPYQRPKRVLDWEDFCGKSEKSSGEDREAHRRRLLGQLDKAGRKHRG